MFSTCETIRTLSKTVEDDEENVDKTIRLIAEDKKCTWLCEIRLTFVPYCSRVRRQFLRFHVVCKTWSIFQELTSIFSFRKRRWKQLKFNENRNKSVTKAKICSEKHNNCVEIFLLLTDVAVVVRVLICLSSLIPHNDSGEIGPLPQYGNFISRIFPYHGKVFHTMELEKNMKIRFFILFLEYLQNTSILWKRSNVFNVSRSTFINWLACELGTQIYLTNPVSTDYCHFHVQVQKTVHSLIWCYHI